MVSDNLCFLLKKSPRFFHLHFERSHTDHARFPTWFLVLINRPPSRVSNANCVTPRESYPLGKMNMKHLNRRKMLGVSLAGGTTTVMNHAWKAAAAAHQDPIQIAVVGVRGTGRRHLQQLQGRRDVRVAALCDVD